MTARRTTQAHAAVARVVCPGDTVIDATAGNGHDTLFLARCVGPHGRVFAFDVQCAAIDATRYRLAAADGALLPRVDLVCESHARMADHVPGSHHGLIAATMFNLGYLPGTDKTLTTRAASTLEAIRAASELLRPGGLLSVLCYVGHAAGLDELQAIEALMRDGGSLVEWHEHDPGGAPPTAPRLFIGLKKAG